MSANMANADRGVRIVLAIVLMMLYVQHIVAGVAAVVTLGIVVVLLATSLAGTCPLYTLLHIGNRKKAKG